MEIDVPLTIKKQSKKVNIVALLQLEETLAVKTGVLPVDYKATRLYKCSLFEGRILTLFTYKPK